MSKAAVIFFILLKIFEFDSVSFAAETLTLPKATLCTYDQPFYPYTMPSGDGLYQQLLKLASESVNFKYKNVFAPRSRCIEGIKNGEYDMGIGIYDPDRLSFLKYPMRQAEPDKSRSFGTVRFNIYALKKLNLKWDGHAFANLGDGQVGAQMGFSYDKKLRALNINVDHNAKSVEQLIHKLTLERVSAIIAPPAAFKDQNLPANVEVLPTPFAESQLYLMISKSFYSKNKKISDNLWQAISKTEKSETYQKLYREKVTH